MRNSVQELPPVKIGTLKFLLLNNFKIKASLIISLCEGDIACNKILKRDLNTYILSISSFNFILKIAKHQQIIL